MKKIFVLNLRGNIIGDSLRESSLFEYLKNEYKDCKITTTGAPLIKEVHKNSPHIDKFIEIKELGNLTKKISKAAKIKSLLKAMKIVLKEMKGYDICVLTQKHKYPYWFLPALRGIEILEKEKIPYKHIPAKIYLAKTRNKKDKKRISINIESNEAERCWDTKKYSKLIEELLIKKYKVCLLGVDIDKNRPLIMEFGKRITNYVGKTTLRESASVIRDSQYYIGNDSGLIHVSYAVGTNTILIMSKKNSIQDKNILYDRDKVNFKKLLKPSVAMVLKEVISKK